MIGAVQVNARMALLPAPKQEGPSDTEQQAADITTPDLLPELAAGIGSVTELFRGPVTGFPNIEEQIKKS
jgi:hypothetical protein